MTRDRLPMRLCGAERRQVLIRRREIAVGEILEQLFTQSVPRRAFSNAVHRDEEPDILVEEQVKIGVEEDRVAAMAHDVQPVSVLVIEAKRHWRQRSVE